MVPYDKMNMNLMKYIWILMGGAVILPLLNGSNSWSQSSHAQLELRADPSYFSPNGDSLNDQAFFYPVLRRNGDPNLEVDRWRMDIKTARGKGVRRLSGEGLPSLIKWDGSNKKERMVKEGEYKATLKIWTNTGKLLSQPVRIFVDNTAPLVSLSVSTTFFQIRGGGGEIISPLFRRWKINPP